MASRKNSCQLATIRCKSVALSSASCRVGHFKNLKAWQHARSLVVLSHAAIGKLPAAERDGLGDQWKRAAYSVVLNIAEGASRRGRREFRRYLDMARASLDEIEAITDLVVALGFLQGEEMKEVVATRDECARTVFGLLRKMADDAKSPDRL